MNIQPADTLKQQLPTEGMVRITALVDGSNPVIPVSRATIYRMIARGDFPKPRKIGRAAVWSVVDIRAWLASLDGPV